MNPQISFIILTWNSEQYIAPCLDSIMDICLRDQLAFEAIVIDNGSMDSTPGIIQSYADRDGETFKLISLPENKGTTYTRNLGIKAAAGDYLCVLDSDTEFRSGSIRATLDLLDNNADLGMVVPRLVLPDGTIQNSVKKFPAFIHKLIKLPKAIFKINVGNIDFYKDFPFAENRLVDTAISACWFFRRGLVDRIGYLDEKIFYSPEDLDYCVRVWKSGQKILYSPGLELLHNTQQISHAKPFSKVSLSHFAGLLYYYRKHGGWFTPTRITSNAGQD